MAEILTSDLPLRRLQVHIGDIRDMIDEE